jgi:Uma2 family endonuclease
MESPWHFRNAALLVAAYVAAHGRQRHDYFIGANMFVYYSTRQIRSQDFKGPDVFIVKEVDGTKPRLSWIAWDEDSRLPDVIFELLSPSTEEYDLGGKKQLYERTFRTREYFCVAPEVERLLGWRLNEANRYTPLTPDERGWLWSEELGLWLGAWRGSYLGEEHTWLRFYTQEGALALLPEEAERQRADAAEQRAESAEQQAQAEHQRAEELIARLAELETELRRMQDH